MEGVPNELHAQNMESRHQYDEIVKHFAEGRLKEAGAIQKDLDQLTDLGRDVDSEFPKPKRGCKKKADPKMNELDEMN